MTSDDQTTQTLGSASLSPDKSRKRWLLISGVVILLSTLMGFGWKLWSETQALRHYHQTWQKAQAWLVEEPERCLELLKAQWTELSAKQSQSFQSLKVKYQDLIAQAQSWAQAKTDFETSMSQQKVLEALKSLVPVIADKSLPAKQWFHDTVKQMIDREGDQSFNTRLLNLMEHVRQLYDDSVLRQWREEIKKLSVGPRLQFVQDSLSEGQRLFRQRLVSEAIDCWENAKVTLDDLWALDPVDQDFRQQITRSLEGSLKRAYHLSELLDGIRIKKQEEAWAELEALLAQLPDDWPDKDQKLWSAQARNLAEQAAALSDQAQDKALEMYRQALMLAPKDSWVLQSWSDFLESYVKGASSEIEQALKSMLSSVDTDDLSQSLGHFSALKDKFHDLKEKSLDSFNQLGSEAQVKYAPVFERTELAFQEIKAKLSARQVKENQEKKYHDLQQAWQQSALGSRERVRALEEALALATPGQEQELSALLSEAQKAWSKQQAELSKKQAIQGEHDRIRGLYDDMIGAIDKGSFQQSQDLMSDLMGALEGRSAEDYGIEEDFDRLRYRLQRWLKDEQAYNLVLQQAEQHADQRIKHLERFIMMNPDNEIVQKGMALEQLQQWRHHSRDDQATKLGDGLAQAHRLLEKQQFETMIEILVPLWMDHPYHPELTPLLVYALNHHMQSIVSDDQRELSFFMGGYEVSALQYWWYLRQQGGQTPALWAQERPSVEQAFKPVTFVDLDQAQSFADWAGARLPREDEWQLAASGSGVARLYPWGDILDFKRFTCADNALVLKAVFDLDSGQSPFGCLHMAGNVAEWTMSPWEPSQEPVKHFSVRGGGLYQKAEDCQISVRREVARTQQDGGLGFRLAADEGWQALSFADWLAQKSASD